MRGRRLAASRRTLAVLGLLAAGAGAWALRGRSSTSEPRWDGDVLLVTLDTLRADRLGAYGYARARTPAMDRLAAEGVRFTAATSTAPLTLPAHASILTGLYPPRHGVRINGTARLDDGFETLATRLRGRGYRTGAFVSAFVLDRRYGLARGFEVYDDVVAVDEARGLEALNLESQRSGDRTARALTAWLGTLDARERCFAWLHLYDPHEPYAPPEPFATEFRDSPYDGEVAFTDSVLGSVRDALERVGRLDHTLVALVGDHGESLGEHGEETHSMLVYEGALRVPLVLWRPGLLPEGRVVPASVSIVDLPATLVELAGLPPLAEAEGRSLLPHLEAGAAAAGRAVYFETLAPNLDMGWAPLRGLRDDRYKLIEAPRPELYDLARDPKEEANLYAGEGALAAGFRKELARLTDGGWGSVSQGRLDPEAREKLAALGYLGGGADAGQDFTPTGADPKDRIEVFNLIRAANAALRDGRWEEAGRALAEIDRRDPTNAVARFFEGSLRMAEGAWRPAIDAFRRFLALRPTRASAHHLLALCHLRLGEPGEALREAEAALALDPGFVDAHVLRGRVFRVQGRLDAAIPAFREATRVDPAKPLFRRALARALEEAGRTDEARRAYEDLLRIQPGDASALAALGVMLAGRGQMDAAAPLLRQALEADPAQDRARFVYAQILEGQGRTTEAEAEYRRLVAQLRDTLARDPDESEARLNLARVLERRGRAREAAAEYRRLADSPQAPRRMRDAARSRLVALSGGS